MNLQNCNTTEHTFIDPYAVGGLERAFRFAINFQKEEPFGAAGMLEQLAIWNEACCGLSETHHSRFCEKVGVRGEAKLFVLDTMSQRLRLLQERLGDDLPIWALLCLISMLADGSVDHLIEQYDACRRLGARELLDVITDGALEAHFANESQRSPT
jgi:hypothetical protein